MISRIQKFCIHDGPGIRTVIYFQGCPLKCVWCHNPEFLNVNKLSSISQEPLNILVEIEKDRISFDQSGGGVTFSGGEPLCHANKMYKHLAELLFSKGISVYIDTSGHVPYSNIEKILPFVDGFLYDIKMMDSSKHRKYTGEGNELILENLTKLSKTEKEIYLRLPLMAGVNDSVDDINNIINRLNENNIKPKEITLLPYHTYGRDKYKKSGMDEPPVFSTPEEVHLMKIRDLFINNGYVVT